MERISLNAEKRELGKGPSKRLRVSGKVPAVLYGRGIESRPIAVDWKKIEEIIKQSRASSVLVDLSIGGETTTTLIRDYQADPFRREITHVDFQAVGLDEKIEVEIPIRLIGIPHGVKEGGVLEQLRRSLNVRCLASNIPASVDVDVEKLDIGDNIHVDDIFLGEGVEPMYTANFAVATVVPPTKEEVPVVAVPPEEVEAVEAEAAEAAPAEGEEKPAEGEAEEKKKKE